MTEFSLILPPFTVSWPNPAQPVLDATIGDIVLIHNKDVASDAIDQGQKLLALTEPSLKDFTWVTHTAYVRSAGPDPAISEMGFEGYHRARLSKYEHVPHAVVHFDFTDAQRAATRENDDAMAGVSYGWAQYVPLILDGLTDAKFEGSWGSSIICSTHVTLALMGGGLFPDRPPSLVVPARIASWVGARLV
jgi:hypothetical protein